MPINAPICTANPRWVQQRRRRAWRMAVAGAVGSIASQIAGNMLGVQDGFSWKSVALSGLSAGVSAGVAQTLGQAGGLLEGNSWQMVAARAATANALTQGIGVLTGLQPSFDWRGVAASAVGAGVGQAIAPELGKTFGWAFENSPNAAMFATRLTTGLVAGTAAAVMRGGKVVVQQVATDAFGNGRSASRWRHPRH